MKKYFLLLFIVVLAVFIGWRVYNNSADDVEVFEVFNDDKHLISSTEYIKDSIHSFEVCYTKDGGAPCTKIEGMRNGEQKWYKDDTIEYIDIYKQNELEKSTLYYKNGLKNHESIYLSGKLYRENYYNDTPNNDLAQSIIYKNAYVIKKYYKNNNILMEEKYENDRLISRKIYNESGVVQRLEEYGFSGDDNPFTNPFDDFDLFEKEFEYEEIMPDIPANDDLDSRNWI